MCQDIKSHSRLTRYVDVLVLLQEPLAKVGTNWVSRSPQSISGNQGWNPWLSPLCGDYENFVLVRLVCDLLTPAPRVRGRGGVTFGGSLTQVPLSVHPGLPSGARTGLRTWLFQPLILTLVAPVSPRGYQGPALVRPVSALRHSQRNHKL